MGVLIISGTGSIAYARDSDGCARRAGGLGPLLGDEGSAFWIGRAWLRGQAKTTNLPVRQVAALATKAIRLAHQGDRNALRIIREAQGALANLVAESVTDMHFPKAVPVSWAGSVLNNPWFRVGWVRAVRRHPKLARRTILWQEPRTDAATAIAYYALYG
jgi:N-acetylglucosamine kinase-like BadF-type ATPase